MLKNKLTLLFLLFLTISVNYSYAEETYNCSYSGKIEQCLASQNNHRSIEDFVCIQDSKERIVYQIVLDEKFKELDKEIELYLDELTKSKDYYFGPNKRENYTVGIDEIEKNLGEYGFFAYKYKKICSLDQEDGIIPEVMKCLGGKTSVFNSKDFLEGSNCEKLYKVKLEVYRDIAYNTLKINKKDIMKDSHKLFTQTQRKKYDNLIDIIRINIGYIERIWKKWPSKTYNIY